VQSVRLQTLQDFELAVPPVVEQQRIVEKLNTLLAKVDASQERLVKISTLLKRFRQSVLAAACSGHLTADWRDITGQSEDWPIRKLSELGRVTGGITKHSSRERMPLQVPYLRVANVYENRLVLEQVLQIGVTEKEFERTRLMKGDLLFVEGNGSLDQIGRVALWDGSIARCVHQNHLIKFRSDNRVLAVYVLLQMMAPKGRSQLVEKATSSAGLNTLSISKISDVNLPVPSLVEQREIVRRVEVLFGLADQIESRFEKARLQIEKLKPTLLSRAFRGQLVPTEADLARREGREYEDAKVMLGRLLAVNGKSQHSRPGREAMPGSGRLSSPPRRRS
jgi:type I restriction enzyme S subunit